jgi:hypothetical protein
LGAAFRWRWSLYARHEGARAASFMVAGNPGSFDPYAYLGQSIVIPTEPRSAFATLKAHF